ncbi:beta-hexosaminidase subunit beta [Brachionus plicatilis]|uniref:Beta-hexosaminidase n=1 Tax=Brachionus plicatilis TaxID=10195 RepID=A0A3M7SU32_BRAPC|nr:beta-hexosaminidase subunit beta [Brachionus plicatilis]
MNKNLSGLILILFYLGVIKSKLFYIEVKYPLLNASSNQTKVIELPLWPAPKFIKDTSKGLLVLSQNSFKMTTNLPQSCDIMEENIKLYTNIFFLPKFELNPIISDTDVALNELSFEISDQFCPGYPNTSIDETYELSVKPGVSIIKANSVWGALRGLETFSQLTFINEDNKLSIKDSIEIKDSPRFSYRGILLDTARHYIPVPIIKKQLDAMSYNKFNVFHWHIVDDQSFAFESFKYPNLTQKGKYGDAHVYTQKDVKEIIDHARLRGIRVIPEFDSPGHVESFGRTFPQFITVCWVGGKPYQAIYSVHGKAEILNPTLEGIYPVLKEVLSEYKEVFQDEYIHLGMDEVYYDCWKSNPNISEWMAERNMTDYHQLEAYYSSKILQIAKDLNKKVTVWQDVYDNGVRPEKTTQIQIWKDEAIGFSKWSDYLNDITSNGYPVILSSPWYINFVSYGFQEWYKHYLVEPMANFTGDAEQAKLLRGGEACLWSEYVDGANIEARLWPRACPIAERLWSPSDINDPEEAKFRLDEQRCRLLRRGIPASPILNGYCGDYEYGMKKSVVFEPEFNYDWLKSENKVPNTNESLKLKLNRSLFLILIFIYHF